MLRSRFADELAPFNSACRFYRRRYGTRTIATDRVSHYEAAAVGALEGMVLLA